MQTSFLSEPDAGEGGGLDGATRTCELMRHEQPKLCELRKGWRKEAGNHEVKSEKVFEIAEECCNKKDLIHKNLRKGVDFITFRLPSDCSY